MTNPIPPLGCRCSGGTRGDRGITDAAPTNGGGGVAARPSGSGVMLLVWYRT